MPSADQSRAARGRVQGRVQGVSFRASMQYEARRLGVCGWVRNCPDGAVEFVAQGNPDALARLLEWARRGPPGARVDNLSVDDAATDPGLARFEVRV